MAHRWSPDIRQPGLGPLDERGFASLLDLIYGSAVDPRLWVKVMETIADAMGGNSAWLSQVSADDGGGAGLISRLDPAMAPLYVDHYCRLNPFAIKARPRDFVSLWTPTVKTDRSFDIEQIRKAEYFNDFMHPQQVDHVIFIGLAVVGVEMVDLNIHRAEARGPFDTPEIELATTLQPHLIRAFRLGQVFTERSGLGEATAAALDHSTHGVFILDRVGRIRHLNRAAERIVARRLGLDVLGGRLMGSAAGDSKTLDGLILRAASLDPAIRGGGSMALRSASRRTPLSLSVAPLHGDGLPIYGSGPCVVVSVTDLEADIELSDRRLRELFALTAAEVRVASMMLRGATPKEAAVQSGVSVSTVRSQLASIFDKTGTSGQAELSRVLMRMVGAGPD